MSRWLLVWLFVGGLLVACGGEEKTAVCQPDGGAVFQGDGYCFVYPAGYCWAPGQVDSSNTFISVAAVDAANHCPDEPLLLHGDVVWVQVAVEPAAGRTTEQVVATLTEGLAGFDFEMEEAVLGGETAVQINNMPGQDISRELVLVHGEQLYRLTFVPASVDYGDRFTEMERLYEQVTRTFHFLP